MVREPRTHCRNGHPLTPENLARSGSGRRCRTCQRACSSKFSSKYERTRVRPALWNIWQGLRQRCKNPKTKRYPNYGGRGIRVCPRWDSSYEAFASDMGPRPSPRHQIERKNNDGHYEPDNCVWATPKANTRNRTTNRLITHAGRTQCLAAWADEAGISSDTLRARLRAGHSMDVALRPLLPSGARFLPEQPRRPTPAPTQAAVLLHLAEEPRTLAELRTLIAGNPKSVSNALSKLRKLGQAEPLGGGKWRRCG